MQVAPSYRTQRPVRMLDNAFLSVSAVVPLAGHSKGDRDLGPIAVPYLADHDHVGVPTISARLAVRRAVSSLLDVISLGG